MAAEVDSPLIVTSTILRISQPAPGRLRDLLQKAKNAVLPGATALRRHLAECAAVRFDVHLRPSALLAENVVFRRAHLGLGGVTPGLEEPEVVEAM